MTSAELNQALEHHRADYAAVMGKPFEHFYCPLLVADEEVNLCMGHVIPLSFPNCCRSQVVQRADIDNWYGSLAEADFGTLLEIQEKGLKGVIADENLRRKVDARIYVDGEDLKSYPYKGNKAADHSRITLEHEDSGDIAHFVVPKCPEELIASQGKKWNLVVDRDCRLAAFLTLVKAAYLTLFRMFGYRYALSCSGLSVGRDLLGKFFEENRHRSMTEVRKTAREFFRPYRHMVRPLQFCDGEIPRGTVEDGRIGVCFGSSGRPYAVIVWVRINQDLHAVLMPDVKHPESAEAYYGISAK
jgi:hypothetical protein